MKKIKPLENVINCNILKCFAALPKELRDPHQLLGSARSVMEQQVAIRQWFPTFFWSCHLWVPCCHHVPPCSRKTHSMKYCGIRSRENQNWHKRDMAVRNYKSYCKKNNKRCT